MSARRREKLPRLTEVEVIEAEEARRSFRVFIRQAWPIINPRREFIPGRYIDAIAEHLEAVSRGEIRDLLINIPPRHGKSTLVSVLWPAWEWISRPEGRWIFVSYAQKLATRDTRKARELILSPWYQSRWAHRFQLQRDQNEKMRYANTHTGYRIAFGLDAGVTGEGGDRIVIDDPHSANPKKAESDAVREAAVETVTSSILNRAEDPKTVCRVVVGQMVHKRDTSNALLARGWKEHLCLPLEFEPHRAYKTSIGKDWRTKPAELLSEERFGPEEVAQLKRDMPLAAQSAQLQQNPTSSLGGIFHREWWRFHLPPGRAAREITVNLGAGKVVTVVAHPRPKRRDMDRVISVWDLSFKRTKAGSYVAGLVIGEKGARRYVLDRFKARQGFGDTKDAIREMNRRWKPESTYVEDEANGPAIIDELGAEIEGLQPVQPEGGKEARGHAAEPGVRAGQWSLPVPEECEWYSAVVADAAGLTYGVDDFIEVMASFPDGEENDTGDAFGHASRQLSAGEPDFV